MAIPSTRQELKDWCKRRCGDTVVGVEISDPQLEDRISEALDMMLQFHTDAVEEMYLVRQITGSELVLTSTTGTPPALHEILEGQTSNAAFEVHNVKEDGTVVGKLLRDVFQAGETITSKQGNYTGTFSTYTEGDVNRKALLLGDDIMGVTKIQRASASGLRYPHGNVLDKMGADSYYGNPFFGNAGVYGYDVVSYWMVKSQLALYRWIHSSREFPTFDFHKATGKVVPVIDFNIDLIDDYFMLHVTKAVDPETAQALYKDTWLRRYAEALVNWQIEKNRDKYNGQNLTGGIQIKANLPDAEARVERLEEELREDYEEAPLGFMG